MADEGELPPPPPSAAAADEASASAASASSNGASASGSHSSSNGSSNGSSAPRAIKAPPSVESIVGHAGGATIVLSSMSTAAQKRYDALNPKAPAFEEQAPPPRRLLLEGLLQKKSPSLFAAMQPRYFVLHSDKIEYWKSEADRRAQKAPQGLIPLYAVKKVINHATTEKGKSHRFDLAVGEAGAASRTFELGANTAQECENWCNTIQSAICELEMAGLTTNATSVMAGSGGSSSSSGAGSDGKFWKDSEKLEALLTAPVPVALSGVGKYVEKGETAPAAAAEEAERPFIRLPKEQAQAPQAPAAAAASPSSPAAAAPASPVKQQNQSTPTPSSPAAATPVEETKPAQKSEQATSAQKPASPAASPAISSAPSSAFSAPAPAAVAASPRAAASASAAAAAASAAEVVEALPVPLQLVKSVSNLGAMGHVFLAKERGEGPEANNFFLVHLLRKLDDGYAVTAMARDLHARMGALHSPFLPAQVCAGQTSDAVFAVYVPACRVSDSLLHHLTLHRRLPEAVVQRIGAQLICLLGYLHSRVAEDGKPLLARNLSPDHLYIDGAGRALFGDVLLAAPGVRLRAARSLAGNGPMAGAAVDQEDDEQPIIPEYLTPESSAASGSSGGGGGETRVSDWWRLGVLLYELAVGIPPFRASSSAPGSKASVDLKAHRKTKAKEIVAKLADYAAAPEAVLKFPPFVSASFASFVRALLVPSSSARLGSSEDDALEVRRHEYMAGLDWARLEMGAEEAGGMPAWMAEKMARAAPPNAQAVAAANPHASPEQLAHACLPSPPQNTRGPQPSARRLLFVRLLGARGLSSSAGGDASAAAAASVSAPLAGDGPDGGVTPRQAKLATKGPNPSFVAGAQSTIVFDFSTSALAQAQAGELMVEMSAAIGAGRASVSIASLPAATLLAPVSALPLGTLSGTDVRGQALQGLVEEVLQLSAVSMSPSSAPLSSGGELQLQALWIDLLIPPPSRAPVPPIQVELETQTTASVFGTCEGAPAASSATAGASSLTQGFSSIALADSASGEDVVRPVDLGRSTPPPTSALAVPNDDDDTSDDDDDDEEGTPAAVHPAADVAASAGGPGGMQRQATAANMLRGLVSKKKLRYQQDGFDLDASYITPRVLAMGFPSEGAEAVYRNPLEQVQRFFRHRHPAGRVRVYNLCSERKYDVMKFEKQVCELPFHDHNAPFFSLMMRFCLDAHAWLAAHPENVVAVHCKAGKGRTGTMIACLLLFEAHCANAEEALRFFGVKRTRNGAGVTIPSQRRYVRYFEDFLAQCRLPSGLLPAALPLEPSPAQQVVLRLTKVLMHTVPDFDIGGGCDPYFLVRGPPPEEQKLYDYRQALKAHGKKVPSCHDKSLQLIELPVPSVAGARWRGAGVPCDPKEGCFVSGDFKLQFFDEDMVSGDDKMFHLALHTSFIASSPGASVSGGDDGQERVVCLTLTKAECDKANKDKKCKHFSKDFKLQLFFV